MTRILHQGNEIIPIGSSGPYTMVFEVSLGKVIERVSVTSNPVSGKTDVYFAPRTSFNRGNQKRIEGIVLCHYFGIDQSDTQ